MHTGGNRHNCARTASVPPLTTWPRSDAPASPTCRLCPCCSCGRCCVSGQGQQVKFVGSLSRVCSRANWAHVRLLVWSYRGEQSRHANSSTCTAQHYCLIVTCLLSITTRTFPLHTLANPSCGLGPVNHYLRTALVIVSPIGN